LIIAEIRRQVVISDFKLNFIKYSINKCRYKRHFAKPRRGSARRLRKGKIERRYLEYMYFILDRYGCNMKAANVTETPRAQSKV